MSLQRQLDQEKCDMKLLLKKHGLTDFILFIVFSLFSFPLTEWAMPITEVESSKQIPCRSASLLTVYEVTAWLRVVVYSRRSTFIRQ